MPTVAIWVQL